jgi:hypothetical protein
MINVPSAVNGFLVGHAPGEGKAKIPVDQLEARGWRVLFLHADR